MKKRTYVDLIYIELKYVMLALEGNDEMDLNIAAYHCQQAVEKTCGYITQRLGIRSIREHKIEKWVRYLKENAVEVPILIEQNAVEISEWESKSRYNINFYASADLISQIADEVKRWLVNVEAISVNKNIKVENNE